MGKPESDAGKPQRVFALGELLLAVALVTFSSSPVYHTFDSMYSMLLSESILHHHSTHLDGYVLEPSPFRVMYQLHRTADGHVVYYYPNGSSILSLPFVALMNLWGVSAATPDAHWNPSGEVIIQKQLASLLMALLTLIVFRTAQLLLPTGFSLAIALGFAFGTTVWSSAALTLWSHTWEIFLEGWVVYLLMLDEQGRRRLNPLLLATILAWMFFVRSTAVVPIICVSIYVALTRPRDIVAYGATGALWFAGFVAYSYATFGQAVPPYYWRAPDYHNFWIASAANLFGPSRGLFVYMPIVLFVIYLVARYWRDLPHPRLVKLSIAIIAVHPIVIAGEPAWWSGFSYGPRLMTDLLPWFVLLSIEGCAAAMRRRRESILSLPELGAALLLLALSIVINGRGATDWACTKWNEQVNLDRHPERVMDWSYPQLAAGLIKPPPYASASNSNAP